MGHWGQATLSPRRWARDVEGRRHWGQTTLRADDFEGRRLWGQATLRAGILYMKNICPQCRLPSTSRDVEGKYCWDNSFFYNRIPKIFALNVARRWGQTTLRAIFWITIFWLGWEIIFRRFIKIPILRNCWHFEYCVYLMPPFLVDICFQCIYDANVLMKYQLLRVSVVPSGPFWRKYAIL